MRGTSLLLLLRVSTRTVVKAETAATDRDDVAVIEQRALVNRLVVELRPTGVGLAQIFQPDLSGVDEGAQMDGVGCVGGD